jgi:hypothetical protein
MNNLHRLEDIEVEKEENRIDLCLPAATPDHDKPPC